jgi:class 3 adenylate cyclase
MRKGTAEVPELVVLNGVARGTSFVLGDVPAVVGRSPEAHLRIADPWISSMHAMFERRDDGLWVVDLESRNGVFVEGERVSEARVPDGTVVRLGRTEIRFIVANPETEDAPAALEPAPGAQGNSDTTTTAIRSRTRTESHGPAAPVPPPERPTLLPGEATLLRLAVDVTSAEPAPAAGRLLRDALGAAATAAAGAGAAVSPIAGVGLLAVFGLDGPVPDDVLRALAVARATRAAVREAGGLDLRAGIETGPVMAGRADERSPLTVLGQAAERTERLVAVARPGEILVGTGAARGRLLIRVGELRVGEHVLEVFRDDGP